MKPTIGWAIKGRMHIRRTMCSEEFLYVGWWMTRHAAIEQHSLDKGVNWETCRARGDRAVKVKIEVM
jgi:hypothetical protein